MGLKRTIYMNMKTHPAGIKPSRAGHSIGHWEGDTLVVDTVGFLPGVLNGPVRNSDKLHVVERFSLDPKTMKLTRAYAADDPVYLKGQYTGSDSSRSPTRRINKAIARNRASSTTRRNTNVRSPDVNYPRSLRIADAAIRWIYMPAPDAASNNLRIRQAKGLEFFVLLFISKRRYTCRECDKVFRAPDRRQSRRDEAASSVTERRAIRS